MNLLFLRTMLLSIFVISALGNQCAELTPTAPPELVRAEFLTKDSKGNPVKTLLKVWNYSAGALPTDPKNFTDLATVPASGTIVLNFSQFLDATTIEVPVYDKLDVDGKPVDRTVGKGEWNNAIPVVKEYTPKNDVVQLNIMGRTAPLPPIQVSYRPDGGVPIDPREPITKAPPPAINVDLAAASATPPAEEVVILHLFSTVKGISGKLIPAAQYADKKDVELAGKKIAATIVFKIQTPAP